MSRHDWALLFHRVGADGADSKRRPAVAVAHYGAALLVAAALVLMVWRPGA